MLSLCNSSLSDVPQAFYLKYRLALGYPWASANADDVVPVFKTLDDWTNKSIPSTKMDALIDIVHHSRKHIRMPPAFVTDAGELQWPSVPEDTLPGDDRPVKVIVYSEFPKYEAGLTSVSQHLHTLQLFTEQITRHLLLTV